MRSVLMIALFAAALLVSTGCFHDEEDGACVGTGGIIDECKAGWSEDECADWNAQNVNGANWDFNEGRSCPSLGYSVRCPDGSYVRPEDESACGF